MFKDLKLKGSQRKGLDQINHDIKESLLYFLILYSQRIYKSSGSSFVLIITILLASMNYDPFPYFLVWSLGAMYASIVCKSHFHPWDSIFLISFVNGVWTYLSDIFL
jgi:hypothetical protein